MFTDVVGFTSLGQIDEELALQLLEEYRSLVRPIMARHGGVEVKTIGDAFLVEFSSALEAVKSAMEIQKTMNDRNAALPEHRRVRLRVGIHVGDVVHAEGDILGDAVNVSSRIEPLASPGGVCISEQVYDHVRNKMGISFEKMEKKTLKNVSIPIDVYRMVMPWESKEEEDVHNDPRRIAVLPLKNLSPDPNDEYFADGMTEELITSLSSVRELTVIARTSVMQYKNAPKRIADIGRELSVGTLIEGSIRKAGNKVRITVQLIDASNEGHLWAKNYDKQLDDVFAIQSEVAEGVAETLKVQLLESERRRIERGSTKNTEAHTLLLQGSFYWNKRTTEGLNKAIELYQRAVRLDPAFALGYAGLAMAYHVAGANMNEDPALFLPKAHDYAIKALSLDPDMAEAHTVLAGHAEDYERDLVKAEAEFRRAIELNPNYPTAHQWYSHILGWEKRWDEARRELGKALELSPLSLIINLNVADLHYFSREYEKGVQTCKKLIEMDSAFPFTHRTLVRCYAAKGMFSEALSTLETYSKIAPPRESKMEYAYVYASMGRKEDSERLLDELTGSKAQTWGDPSTISLIYFLQGDTDRGFEWMEKAYASYDRLLYTMAVTPELDNFRSDRRYVNLLERTGLAAQLRD
jgi:TolB-like protein/Flp pilus assembly protein TadD